ncbi:MAG TPA: toxin C-terminal domain-containing protein [Microbacteriaceae bacterium]|nr:toxin C-terminal domain-containing protein [Microbacteriaceae bacterium]
MDPVAGGNVNNYLYPNDPVDGSDLTGLSQVDGGGDGLPTGWWTAAAQNGARANSFHGVDSGSAKPRGAPRLTAPEIRKEAGRIGASVVKGERAHGQQIYKVGKKFISYDVDGHNGGFWKVATSVKNLLANLE